MEGTKNFEAFGGLITKEFKEGLSGKGRKRVGMMIDAPFGESGVLIFTMNVSTKRSVGLEVSHGVYILAWAKVRGELPWTEGGERGLTGEAQTLR